MAIAAERITRLGLSVYYYFRRWRDAECFVAVHDWLRRQLRITPLLKRRIAWAKLF